LLSDGAEAAQLFGFEEARGEGCFVGDEGSSSRNCADDAVALEVLEGAGDGVRVDAELGRGAASGREDVAGTEQAGGDGVLDLLLELQVHRDTGVRRDVKRQHTVLIR
jgi:hypothetical protein